MKKTVLFALIMLLFLCCGEVENEGENTNFKNEASFVVTGQIYDIGDPTNKEVLSLELINRARSNPKKEGEFLAATGDSNIEGAISYFNVNTDILKSDFAGYTKKPPIINP